MGLGLVAAWAWVSQPEEPLRPERYVEAGDDLSRWVELGGVGILTSENFVGHRIRVIEGSLTNVSDQPLVSVELLLTFRSVEGDPILESSEEALERPLDPGGGRRYVFRFENLPPDWDYRVPVVTLVRVGL